MAYLSLSPVSVGVYAALNVAGLTALVQTRIYDDVPQAPTYPFVWYEVSERDVRGFGTGGLPEVELRVHTFSKYAGMKEAQAINQKVIELLRDQLVTVSGYTQAGRVFYDETLTFADELINGEKVQELVSQFRIYVEE
jgi:hypothetical protein